jgi:hypothetical protein
MNQLPSVTPIDIHLASQQLMVNRTQNHGSQRKRTRSAGEAGRFCLGGSFFVSPLSATEARRGEFDADRADGPGQAQPSHKHSECFSIKPNNGSKR